MTALVGDLLGLLGRRPPAPLLSRPVSREEREVRSDDIYSADGAVVGSGRDGTGLYVHASRIPAGTSS